MRKPDPKGDLGRNDRQKQVLQALANKAISFSSFTKVNEMITILGENMKTNLIFDEIKNYSKSIKEWKDYDIKTIEIAGETEMIDGTYYYEVSEDERQNIVNQLKDHLHSHELE